MYNIIYQDDDFVILVEWVDGLPFFHHHVFNWSPSVYKKAVKEFNKLLENLAVDGHKELWSYYDKQNEHLDKFCKKFNFIKVGQTDTEHIVLKEI